MWKDPDVILGHIIQRGFVEKYTVWTYHGEVAPPVEIGDIWFDQTEDFIIDDMSRQMTGDFGGIGFDAVEVDIDLDLEDMLRHAEPEVLTEKAKDLNNWEALQKSTKDLLYDQSKGCDMQYTVLRSVLELLRLKARHGWSDTSFNDLMGLLRAILPKPNLLPANTYQAKKLICPLSLGVEKIHACINHCVLYRNEYADLDKCPTCGASRYKKDNSATDSAVAEPNTLVEPGKKIPAMVMWYLPVKDRMKRLFPNPADAELMRWHQEGRKTDGMIRHPADAR